MKNKKYLLGVIIGFIAFTSSYTQWLDHQSLQNTVLLEKVQGSNFITHGTGFLMYNYDNPSEYIVVTCAHLVNNKKILSVRVKPDSTFLRILKSTGQKQLLIDNALVLGNTVRFLVSLEGNNCYVHPKLDIAAFRLKIPAIAHKTDTSETVLEMTKLLGIPNSGLVYRNDLALGDEVYFIGFPLGYGATEFVEPIVRSGSIAWLPSQDDLYLLDAFSYGGNSGSPIFQKVIYGNKPGQHGWSGAKLIGMVTGHQGIKLENILNQPNPQELKFEVTDIDLNIGLATCVYIDDIMFTINELQKNNK